MLIQRTRREKFLGGSIPRGQVRPLHQALYPLEYDLSKDGSDVEIWLLHVVTRQLNGTSRRPESSFVLTVACCAAKWVI